MQKAERFELLVGLVKLLGAGPGKEDRRKFLERLQSWPERLRVKALVAAACF
jgi:hypothetical protein